MRDNHFWNRVSERVLADVRSGMPACHETNIVRVMCLYRATVTKLDLVMRVAICIRRKPAAS